MRKIASGIYTLSLEHEFMGEQRTIRPAAIETETGLILVDVGLPDHVDSIRAQLEENGFQLEDVETIIITHQDGDHAGGLSEVKTRSSATVAAHMDDAPYIEGDHHPIKGDERYPPATVDIEVVDGVKFSTVAGKMNVVATPGHTPGHISLYLPNQKFLIAADALTAEDGFGGPNEEFTPDMEAAVDSISRLASLSVKKTLCYHGGLTKHGPERIKNIHASLQE